MKKILTILALSASIFSFAQPANDNCSNATTLVVNSTSLCGQSLDNGTTQPGECQLGYAGASAASVWYRITATQSQLIINYTQTFLGPYQSTVRVYGPFAPSSGCITNCASSIYNQTFTNNTTPNYITLSGLSTTGNNQYLIQIEDGEPNGAPISNRRFCIGVFTSCFVSTTWNGTTWSNGSPTNAINAIIDGTYDTAINGNFECCSLTVNSFRLLTIRGNNHVTVVNGNLVVNNNGSLVQINNSGVNTGNITYQRTAMARNLDYVYWSSPVSNFNVGNLPNSFRYIWNPTLTNGNGGQGNWVAASGNMESGKGYIARASNGSDTPIATTTTFTGVPFNGVITTPIQRGTYQGVDYLGTNGITITRFSDNFNLIGNPYPSAINVLDFLNMNTNIEGAVRIWTHGTLPSSTIPNPFYGSFQANYTPNDYITHNGTGTVSGPNGFNGFMASGQGFFVLMNDGPTTTDSVTFNNSLRRNTYGNSQFYRTSDESNNNRIWLDIIDNNNVSARTLIGYVDDATDDKDRLYDAVTSVSTSMHIYSLIGQDKMTIQGKSLPFNSEDRVRIGYNVLSTGIYSIGIVAVDGLFSNSLQNIYLEDTELGVIHNMRQNPYSFSANAGNHPNRFILRYTNETLGNEDFLTAHTVIYSNNGINIKNDLENIKKVSIFDTLGRLVYENDYNDHFVNIQLNTKGVYIIKITFEEGNIVEKKVIN